MARSRGPIDWSLLPSCFGTRPPHRVRPLWCAPKRYTSTRRISNSRSALNSPTIVSDVAPAAVRGTSESDGPVASLDSAGINHHELGIFRSDDADGRFFGSDNPIERSHRFTVCGDRSGGYN